MAMQHDKQFKLDAIRYYQDHKDLGVRGCAENLGIGYSTLTKWLKGQCSDPDEDDDRILGCKLNIADVQDHISVVFIDALRDVASELGKPKNPIRRIIESVESLIKESELNTIKSEIVQLNKSIAVTVPQYILGAIAFASKEVISIDIVFKMIE